MRLCAAFKCFSKSFNFLGISTPEIGEFKDKRATDIFLSLLNENNEDILCAAIDALGKLGDRKAEKYLLLLVSHKSPKIRSKVALALGNLE